MTDPVPSKEHVHSYHMGKCTPCLLAEIETARRTAEHWKAEHLAGNAEIDRLNADLAFIRRRTGFWGEVPTGEPRPVQIGTHPMIDVMLICDAYESGMGQGLKNKPMGEYRNPYDPVNDPHTYRAYGLGYDEGTKRSTAAPLATLAGVVAELRANGYHTWATAIERASQPPEAE